MVEYVRGIKAGITGGIITGVVFPIVITFFGAVFGLSSDTLSTTMYLATVIQFIILGVVGGLIFGVIYAVVYESLPGDYSIVKGVILSLAFWVVFILIVIVIFGTPVPSLIAVSLMGPLIFGALVGFSWWAWV